MKGLKNRFLAAGLAVATVGFATNAFGEAITDTASFNVGLLTTGGVASGPPLSPIFSMSLDSNSRAVTNTFNLNPFLPGSIRTVGVFKVPQAEVPAQGSSAQTVVGPTGGLGGGPGGDVIAIFGIQGQVESLVSGTAIAQFTEGKIAFFQVAPNSVNLDDPATWGFATGVLLGEYTIADPTDVTRGLPQPTEGDNISFTPGSIVNRSAVNVDTTNENQGRFLVTESLVSTVPGKVLPGTPFQTNIPGAVSPFKEGLFFNLDQEVQDPGSTVADGTKLGDLNAIATWAFGDAFATFGTGTQSDFINIDANPGDFTADLGGVFRPVAVRDVPEPATLSLLALGGLGLLARRRRQA